MLYLNSFQKKVVNEIVKTHDDKQIDLSQIFLHFLPKDLYVGKSELLDTFCVWYKIDKEEYVYGDLSINVLNFIKVIDDLVKYNYILKVEKRVDIKADFSIGEKVDNNQYGWRHLGVNLSYGDLESFFNRYLYFPTEDLHLLPKHKYMQIDNYRADRSLFLLRLSVYAALITTLLSFLSLLLGR